MNASSVLCTLESQALACLSGEFDSFLILAAQPNSTSPGVTQVANPKEPASKQEEREVVDFKGPTDSVYLATKDYVELDVGTGAAVAISSSGWEDVVVVRHLTCQSRHNESAERRLLLLFIQRTGKLCMKCRKYLRL
jgi:hypothetical protein